MTEPPRNEGDRWVDREVTEALNDQRPAKYLHPIPRTLAAMALVVGGSSSVVYLDWRWILVGLLTMLGCALAGPWEERP